jgi:glutathione S-transferase
MAIVLYDLVGRDDDVRFSPHCWKVRMSLAHKGLAYRTTPVRFIDVGKVENGASKTVPVLRDGDCVISDSFSIAEYLDVAYPHAPLFGGEAGRSTARFIERWSQLTLHPYIGIATLMEELALLDPQSAAYFRRSREARFGHSLETRAAERAPRLMAFRVSLEPLRSMLSYQPFIGGSGPLYSDYIVFGAFQWARVTSNFQILTPDDPIRAWFDRCLDLHGGLGRSAAKSRDK